MPCDIESMVSVFVRASHIVASVFNALLYLMVNTKINRILNEINVGKNVLKSDTNVTCRPT